MKIKIVQLSDFHIQNSFNSKIIVNKMIDSIISNDNINDIIICITGDLTQSANEKQFIYFENFLSCLKIELEKRNQKTTFLLVPGNHDLMLNNVDINRFDNIREAFNKNTIENCLEKESKLLTNFLNFSKHHFLFENNYFADRYIKQVGNKTINFVLLNTALFSSKSKEDKDFHYIPQQYLEIDNSSYDYTIIIMHHSHEWFSDKCQGTLLNLLKQSSLCLYGHKHYNDVCQTNDFICFQNSYIDVNNLEASQFSINNLDLETGKLEHILVTYDTSDNIFVRNYDNIKVVSIPTSNINKAYITSNKLLNEKKYINLSKDKFNLNDLFVFPLLQNIQTEKYISTYNELNAILDTQPAIGITGDNSSGKTTLLKKVFIESLTTYKYVLFVDNIDLITNNFEKSVKIIFDENYNQEKSYNAFLQAPINDRIIIIDNVNPKNKKHLSFLKESKSFFKTTIFTINSYLLNQSSILQLDYPFDLTELNLKQFTYNQRIELIHNFLKALNENSNQNEAVEKCIESMMINDCFFDLTSPDYLSMLIYKIIKEKLFEERDTNNAFSLIFENNIFNLIKDTVGDTISDDYYTFLRDMAYFMFSKKDVTQSYNISNSEIVIVLNDCKEKWGIKIPLKAACDFIIESNFMKQIGDDIFSFTKNSYFSYFIAKAILSKNDNFENVDADITKLAKNVLFGNYSDILLFIAYFSNSKRFFDNVISSLLALGSKSNLLSFDTQNNIILKKINNLGFSYKDKFENKSSFDKRQNRIEQNKIKIEQDTKKEDKFSNIDISDEDYIPLKMVKLIEIICKACSGYKGKITLQQRTQMIYQIKDSTYKILYMLFDFDEELLEQFYQKIESTILSIDSTATKKEIEKKFTNDLYQIITTFSLNILTQFASILVSKCSIDIIKNIPDYDSDRKVNFNNILFKTICFERYGSEDVFSNYISSIYAKIKNTSQQFLIRKVFSLFIITSNVSYTFIDKMCSIMNIPKNIITALPYSQKYLCMQKQK